MQTDFDSHYKSLITSTMTQYHEYIFIASTTTTSETSMQLIDILSNAK